MVNTQTSNKLLLHTSFNDTIKDLNDVKISLPLNPSPFQMDFTHYIFPPNGQLVTPLEDISSINLDANEGEKSFKSHSRNLAAYDESINKFSCLEGTAFLISHSLIILDDDNYNPTNLLTFNFYTRSRDISNHSKFIKYSDDPEKASKIDYIYDKYDLLKEHTPKHSILFIDGPLIGGDAYTQIIGKLGEFVLKDILLVYFIKNSASNLVTDNVEELKGKFNSDMHWVYNYLKKGQRTSFFRYVDRNNVKNAKIFCYVKPFDISPLRVEFNIETYNRFRDEIDSIMDLIFYLMLAQGDYRNPQLRPIAIAEKFARDTLHLVDINKITKESGLIPTINQERFGW